jgi:membrane-associated phospholipid phosphatase
MGVQLKKPLLAMLAAIGPLASGAADATEQAGDVLSYALPAGTLAIELWRGEKTGALQFVESFAVTMTATEILKRTTHVERPDHSNDESFPSGHASRAFAAATYVHRRYGFADAWPLYVLSTYVGYTRVQANRHRWTDVVGSTAVAAASSWWLVEPKSMSVSVSMDGRTFFVAWCLPVP